MALLAAFATSLPPLLLQGFFDMSTVGQYAVAARFLVVPTSVISGAVGEPFRVEYVARMKSGRDTPRLIRRALFSLASVAVPVFGLAALAAPTVTAIVLGHRFNDAGQYVRLMSLGVLGQFVAAPVAYVFVATNRAKLGLVMQALVTLAPAVALAIVAPAGSIGPALLAQSTALLTASAMYAIAAYVASKRSYQLNWTMPA